MFYDNYLRLCRKKGKSPSKVAEECGISRPSVSRWKNGAVPYDVNLLALADYFGCTIEALLDDNAKAPAAQGDRRSMEAQEKYDLLSPEDQKIVMDLMDSLARKQRGGQT